MPKFAPELPTTQTLHERYQFTPEQREAIADRRDRVSHKLGGHSAGLLVVVGPCAMTRAEQIMRHEARQMRELTGEADADIEGLYREPDWKPRTREEDWHGLMTTEPEAAYRILHEHAATYANVAIEIGADPRHLERNSDLVTLAWKGGRNDVKGELTDALALHDPTLPIAIKNGLDGNIDRALADVERIESLRGDMGARAILLFRGGANAQNLDEWEEQYLLTHERTGGRFLVDWAHGGEQAGDLRGNFGKSKLGQIACMFRTIEIAKRTGKTPVGVFSEATDAQSPTDPTIPFELAIEGAQVLAEIRQSTHA
jgi:phospho-2-dehydro-3-deoxyheptonate aldolase